MGCRASYLRIALALAPLAVASVARAQSASPSPPPPPPAVEPAPAEPPPPPTVIPEPPFSEPPPPPPLVPEEPAQPPAPPPVVAQPPVLEPPAPPVIEEGPVFEAPPPRPRMSLAVGMGATRDGTGFSDGAHFIPSFFAEGGFGDGLTGFDLGAFSSSAFGRYNNTTQTPIDRLALDAFGVIRPAARWHRDDQRYRMRVLHLLAAELGLGFERDGTTTASGTRFVIHTGARAEFPLSPPGQPSELRLRIAVRRAIGLYTPVVEVGQPGSGTTVSVGDSVEFFAALAVIF